MSQLNITLADIERLRAYRWRIQPARRISGERGALRLIKELGFVLLVSIGHEDMPSIHAAAGGDWGVWWDWKQTLPERKACYYAKVIRRRGTFISWDWFPRLYAAYADPRPYWRLYRDGLLDRTEKQVLDLLSDHGPMMTRELRLEFGPRSEENTRRVKSILVDLQTRFLVTAAGGDTSGWSHHRWDLVERWAPARSLTAAARLSREEARAQIIERFVANMTATSEADICWTFGWERRQVAALVADLLARGRLQLAHAPELEADVLVSRPWPGRAKQ